MHSTVESFQEGVGRGGLLVCCNGVVVSGVGVVRGSRGRVRVLGWIVGARIGNTVGDGLRDSAISRV